MTDDLTARTEEAAAALVGLRWKEDMVVMNPFGEVVWLKPSIDEKRNRTGITDCCPESDPCEHHARLTAVPRV